MSITKEQVVEKPITRDKELPSSAFTGNELAIAERQNLLNLSNFLSSGGLTKFLQWL